MGNIRMFGFEGTLTFWISGLITLSCLFVLTISTALLYQRITALHLGRSIQTKISDQVARNHPFPIWISSNQGDVIWKNDSFAKLSSEFTQDLKNIDKKNHRRAVKTNTEGTRWLDIFTIQQNDQTIFYTADANDVVQQEASRQEFVQTLSKTFAYLSTGLAIFNSNRTLAMFNPALLDLTGLSFETFSRHPDLSAFLDILRDQGIIPEPANYIEWRNKISHIESASISGSFCEIWNLPGGRSLKVMGRPHPDHSIALLFEDISQHVISQRKSQAEIDLFETSLNALPQSIAIFDPTGAMVFANSACISSLNLRDVPRLTIDQFILSWDQKTKPSPLWQQIERAAKNSTNRDVIQFECWTRTNQEVAVRSSPLPGRNTLVEVTLVPTAIPHQKFA